MIYGYQLQDLILLWFILKLFAMLNLMQKENEHDQANIFQETYLESSQIHQLAILHRFQHINHDIILRFLIQNICKLLML